MEPMFQGERVAFITGAASGIGRATAEAFAREGVHVAIADVDRKRGEQVAQSIAESAKAKAVFIPCDVSQEADVQKAIDQTEATLGRIDYAFNNAGIEGESNSTMDCESNNWNRVISINLTGIWLCMKYELRHLVKRGRGGVIVNCSSVAGLVGLAGIPAYVASKHGVIGLTKTAAVEFAKAGIRVNAVCPGAVVTPLLERFFSTGPEVRDSITAQHPLGRLGKPEEIAHAVVWLCSDRASFVTGTAMTVDGGWTCY